MLYTSDTVMEILRILFANEIKYFNTLTFWEKQRPNKFLLKKCNNFVFSLNWQGALNCFQLRLFECLELMVKGESSDTF